MLVSSVMFIIQLPNVRVRLWHLWVKRRKRGRSGKLGGKSWLCFRTAEEGNVAVFSISVYPSLNNFRISAFSKVRYLNESRMNGREKEWSTPKTTFQCLKGSMELGLVRARRSLALLHSDIRILLIKWFYQWLRLQKQELSCGSKSRSLDKLSAPTHGS